MTEERCQEILKRLDVIEKEVKEILEEVVKTKASHF